MSMLRNMPFAGDYPVSLAFGANPELFRRVQFEGAPLRGHSGLDFELPAGVPILAVQHGVVLDVRDDDDGYGRSVLLGHRWGQTFYGHLAEVKVEKGQQAAAGQAIGVSGATGRTEGERLHFGLRLVPYTIADGWCGFTDPAPYLARLSKGRGAIIGPHIIGSIRPHLEVLSRWRPRLITVLDPSPDDMLALRDVCPDSTIVARIFVPDHEISARIRNNPSEAANWVHEMTLARMAYGVDYWQVANEVLQDYESLPLLNQFERARMALADEAGYRCAIMAFSVGNPDLPESDRMAAWRQVYPALAYAEANGHVVAVHQYGMPDLWGPNQAYDWYIYRLEHQVLRRLPFRRLKFVVTEYGIDGLIRGDHPAGWQTFTTPEGYVEQLLKCGRYLERFSGQVLGYSIFTLGHYNPWQTYDIAGKAAAYMADLSEKGTWREIDAQVYDIVPRESDNSNEVGPTITAQWAAALPWSEDADPEETWNSAPVTNDTLDQPAMGAPTSDGFDDEPQFGDESMGIDEAASQMPSDPPAEMHEDEVPEDDHYAALADLRAPMLAPPDEDDDATVIAVIPESPEHVADEVIAVADKPSPKKSRTSRARGAKSAGDAQPSEANIPDDQSVGEPTPHTASPDEQGSDDMTTSESALLAERPATEEAQEDSSTLEPRPDADVVDLDAHTPAIDLQGEVLAVAAAEGEAESAEDDTENGAREGETDAGDEDVDAPPARPVRLVEPRIALPFAAYNMQIKGILARPDRPLTGEGLLTGSDIADVVYLIKDIFMTYYGSWEPSGEYESVPDWAREDYLRPSFLEAGADHHLFAAVIGLDGELRSGHEIAFWSDGYVRLSDPGYTDYTRERTKDSSGWANLFMAGGSSFVPQRGETGPWCWAPIGAAEVVVGGGLPVGHPVSTFVVWQAVSRTDWEATLTPEPETKPAPPPPPTEKEEPVAPPDEETPPSPVVEIERRVSEWIPGYNITMQPISARPDHPQAEVVYVVKDIFTTRNGSWEPISLPGSVPQWARDSYLKPVGSPDYFDDAGGDHHLFAAVIGLDGKLQRGQEILYWSDGFEQLGDPEYQGFVRRYTKEQSGWANIITGPGSSFVPERNESGPWCWAPAGAAEVVCGGGMPANHHISFFVVWQAVQVTAEGKIPGTDEDFNTFLPSIPGTAVKPATSSEPSIEAGGLLLQLIRQSAWMRLGIELNVDSALAAYARRHNLGMPVTQEFEITGYRAQGFHAGVVFVPTGQPQRIGHLSW